MATSKGGRPPRATEAATRTVCVRLTSTESTQLDELARDSGRSASDLFRSWIAQAYAARGAGGALPVRAAAPAAVRAAPVVEAPPALVVEPPRAAPVVEAPAAPVVEAPARRRSVSGFYDDGSPEGPIDDFAAGLVTDREVLDAVRAKADRQGFVELAPIVRELMRRHQVEVVQVWDRLRALNERGAIELRPIGYATVKAADLDVLPPGPREGWVLYAAIVKAPGVKATAASEGPTVDELREQAERARRPAPRINILPDDLERRPGPKTLGYKSTIVDVAGRAVTIFRMTGQIGKFWYCVVPPGRMRDSEKMIGTFEEDAYRTLADWAAGRHRPAWFDELPLYYEAPRPRAAAAPVVEAPPVVEPPRVAPVVEEPPVVEAPPVVEPPRVAPAVEASPRIVSGAPVVPTKAADLKPIKLAREFDDDDPRYAVNVAGRQVTIYRQKTSPGWSVAAGWYALKPDGGDEKIGDTQGDALAELARWASGNARPSWFDGLPVYVEPAKPPKAKQPPKRRKYTDDEARDLMLAKLAALAPDEVLRSEAFDSMVPELEGQRARAVLEKLNRDGLALQAGRNAWQQAPDVAPFVEIGRVALPELVKSGPVVRRQLAGAIERGAWLRPGNEWFYARVVKLLQHSGPGVEWDESAQMWRQPPARKTPFELTGGDVAIDAALPKVREWLIGKWAEGSRVRPRDLQLEESRQVGDRWHVLHSALSDQIKPRKERDADGLLVLLPPLDLADRVEQSRRDFPNATPELTAPLPAPVVELPRTPGLQKDSFGRDEYRQTIGDGTTRHATILQMAPPWVIHDTIADDGKRLGGQIVNLALTDGTELARAITNAQANKLLSALLSPDWAPVRQAVERGDEHARREVTGLGEKLRAGQELPPGPLSTSSRKLSAEDRTGSLFDADEVAAPLPLVATIDPVRLQKITNAVVQMLEPRASKTKQDERRLSIPVIVRALQATGEIATAGEAWAALRALESIGVVIPYGEFRPGEFRNPADRALMMPGPQGTQWAYVGPGPRFRAELRARQAVPLSLGLEGVDEPRARPPGTPPRARPVELSPLEALAAAADDDAGPPSSSVPPTRGPDSDRPPAAEVPPPAPLPSIAESPTPPVVLPAGVAASGRRVEGKKEREKFATDAAARAATDGATPTDIQTIVNALFRLKGDKRPVMVVHLATEVISRVPAKRVRQVLDALARAGVVQLSPIGAALVMDKQALPRGINGELLGYVQLVT